MKVLKLLLWLILLLCLLWISAIFFGPMLIKNATSYLSEGKINLTRVKVSPNLKISAAVVDFSIPTKDGRKQIEGLSRAVSVNWQVESGFELVGKIGPSTLNDYGNVSSANFSLKPISFLDWSNVAVELEFEKLFGNNFELVRGYLTGKFFKSFNGFKGADLFIENIRGETMGASLEAAELDLSMEDFNLSRFPLRPDFKITYSIQQLSSPEIAFKSASVFGEVALTEEGVVFTVTANKPHLERQQLKADFMTLSSSYSFSTKAIDDALKFSISEIQSNDPPFQIKRYSGFLTATNSGFTHAGRAIILQQDLKNDRYFVGQIEDGILDVKLTSSITPGSIKLEGKGVLTLNNVDDFSASVSTKSFHLGKNIFDCIRQKCQLESLEAEYGVVVSDTSLSGDLKCERSGCFTRPTKHVLQTDNTNRFFQALREVRTFSPLLLPVAYLIISGGEAVGDGHLVKF